MPHGVHGILMTAGDADLYQIVKVVFVSSSAGKESACNVGDLGSIPGLGRSPEEGKGYPLQYSGLENSMDCTVHGVAKSWTRLSDFHFHFQLRENFLYLLPSFTACCKEKAYFEISSVQSLSHVQVFVIPWTVQSMEFSRLEYWRG